MQRTQTYSVQVTIQEQPKCERHESAVSMNLHSLHTDVARPAQLIGMYACPDCGHESRFLIEREA